MVQLGTRSYGKMGNRDHLELLGVFRGDASRNEGSERVSLVFVDGRDRDNVCCSGK